MDDTLTMSVESDKRTRTRSPNREQSDDTQSAALPQLSNELTDRILDYLHDDVPTLKNCSLTCRSFLQRSRFNLFRIISVNIRNVQKFCDLLGEVPQLGIYVRELRVVGNPTESDLTWVDTHLPLITPKLQKVAHLYLTGGKQDMRFNALPFKPLKAVKQLTILGSSITNLNQFCDLLGSFPELEILYSNEIFVFRSPQVDARSPSPSKCFKRASFNSCRVDPAQLVDWLVQERMLVNMEYFCVCPLQHVGVPPVGRLIRECGTALKHFKLALVGQQVQGGFVGV